MRPPTKTETDIAALRARVKSSGFGLAKIKSWGSSAKKEAIALRPAPKPTSKAAQLASLNALKRCAKGDEKLAPENRVYLRVEAEAASTSSKLPKADLFFSADWAVGRLLDECSRRLQVANVNSSAQKEEDRLRVYHVEGGRVLEFSERVGKCLVSGNSVVLLRGVGPGFPDLVES